MDNIHPFARGSEWRVWDLHVHSPASFHWKGQKLNRLSWGDPERKLIDDMISALNEAEPAVFALMDYWTFDGWLALKKRLAEAGAPKLTKKVFPGIELRLAAPTKCRLNAHVLFSDAINEHDLADFKSALTIAVVDAPLSDPNLIKLARTVGPDMVRKVTHDPDVVATDDDEALVAGSKIAEIECESYKKAIAKVPEAMAIGFMPYDTSDGLAEVKWQDHYSYFLGLFSTSPIFESRNANLRTAFIGEKTPENSRWFDNFQHGLKNVPRLVVSGSDAHRFRSNLAGNDDRGYGHFPSGQKTWIKADPTFAGLKQAMMEPSKRSFIGETPAKLREIASGKTFFLNRIQIEKHGTAQKWLHGCDIPLNSDLVAIIGNKGSGKSALADVVALSGYSKQHQHFTFLKKNRFRGRSGDPARQFTAKLTWEDGTLSECNLNDNPIESKPELVRYIPQGHFEALCNDHITGATNAFEQELRAVIFSHAGEELTLGALDFNQLVEQQEGGYRGQLNELRKDLRKLNQEISLWEDQLQPSVASSLNELLTLKNKQIEELEKEKPSEITKPSDELTQTQVEASKNLDTLAEGHKTIEAERQTIAANITTLSARSMGVQRLLNRVKLLQKNYSEFEQECATDFSSLGLEAASIATLKVDLGPIEAIGAKIPVDLEIARKRLSELDSQQLENLQKQDLEKTKLNAPQREYQQYLTRLSDWQIRMAGLVGTADKPDSLGGLSARIQQLADLPKALETRRIRRNELMAEIYDILEAQRAAREKLFSPLHDLVQEDGLIRDEYRLRFLASLAGSSDAISESLFSLIKQNSGEFRGEEESFAAVRKLAEAYDFNKKEELLAFVSALDRRIQSAAGANQKGAPGLSSILRKDKSAAAVYDLLFGLEFISPKYSLQFQDTSIEHLSPGQRGALLLIFYLLVDKGQYPIILDQPEENLDNETVVSLLVPVLTKAKRRRQIIMVTHNPNLAVVCDAEQIIYSHFDRKSNSTISYYAGSIENPIINTHVVNVLEGRKPAFHNRRRKYH